MGQAPDRDRQADRQRDPRGHRPSLTPDSPFFWDVLAPFENALDGTWSSGDLPQEVSDFTLMRAMHWSWRDLQATPPYVKAYYTRFLDAIAERQNRNRKPNGS